MPGPMLWDGDPLWGEGGGPAWGYECCCLVAECCPEQVDVGQFYAAFRAADGGAFCATCVSNPITMIRTSGSVPSPQPSPPVDGDWYNAILACNAPCNPSNPIASGTFDVWIWCTGDGEYWLYMAGLDQYGALQTCGPFQATEVRCDCWRVIFDIDCDTCCSPDGFQVVCYITGDCDTDTP